MWCRRPRRTRRGARPTSRSRRDEHPGSRGTIDAFTTRLKSGKATPFEATYVTTGSSPATIVYAVMRPEGIAVRDTPSGGGAGSAGISRRDIVANASGECSCTPPSTGSGTSPGWSCQQLGAVSAASLAVRAAAGRQGQVSRGGRPLVAGFGMLAEVEAGCFLLGTHLQPDHVVGLQ